MPDQNFLNNTKKFNAILDSQKHPFHILRPSLYPIAVSFFLFCWLVPQTFFMHGIAFAGSAQIYIIIGSVTALSILIMSWFMEILRESVLGYHTKRVQKGLRLGMVLFIVSEVMFFFAFFWAFFHYSLVPSAAIGATWPPTGTQEVNTWGLPLVNTMLLLTSGVTITIAHARILKNNVKGFFWYLLLTITLGIFFLFCQGYEYRYGIKFSWRDNIYGSIFFVTTGFHGFHVTIGTIFLIICWIRVFYCSILLNPAANVLRLQIKENRLNLAVLAKLKSELERVEAARDFKMTAKNHFGFEAAAWYWHFVDVVWLFLFVTIYWWSGL